jgi:hypothetical protein
VQRIQTGRWQLAQGEEPSEHFRQAQLIICRQMELNKKESKEKPSNQYVMNFNSDEFELMAQSCHQPLRRWTNLVLNATAKKSLKETLQFIGERTPKKQAPSTLASKPRPSLAKPN